MTKLVILLLGVVVTVHGHARMMRPTSRSSIWRLPEYASQNPPVNQQDEALRCGNIPQVDDPGSNCGVCGDPFSDPVPRANEIGGFYDKGIITGVYNAGDVIGIEMEVRIVHGGTWEWRLCTDPHPDNQACFNNNVLQLADGSGTKYPAGDIGTHVVRLRLPAGVTCQRCVIQWNHNTAQRNNYRGCADVTIA